MKTKLDADDLNLFSLAKEYADERKAIALFEAMRWPGGGGARSRMLSDMASAKDLRVKSPMNLDFNASCRNEHKIDHTGPPDPRFAFFCRCTFLPAPCPAHICIRSDAPDSIAAARIAAVSPRWMG